MNNKEIKITKEDIKKINELKKYFTKCETATFNSQRRANKKLKELAVKYNTDTQTIYDSATIN